MVITASQSEACWDPMFDIHGGRHPLLPMLRSPRYTVNRSALASLRIRKGCSSILPKPPTDFFTHITEYRELQSPGESNCSVEDIKILGRYEVVAEPFNFHH